MTEKSDTAEKRPLIIEMLCYPLSVSAIIQIGLIVIITLLINFMARVIRLPYIFLVFHGLRAVLGGYFIYYFQTCVRESALGNDRAPALPFDEKPDMSECVSLALQLFAVFALCLFPAMGYRIVTQKTGGIFTGLLLVGIYFLPMGLLAVSIFQSSSGLNPWIWFVSIFSTFFPYTVLTFLLAGLIYLSVYLFSDIRNTAQILVLIYMLLIFSNLLGRFYRRYQDKLNWDA